MLRDTMGSRSPAAKTKSEFSFFVPLVACAVGLAFFELLPMDFQHAVAPRIVTWDDVYFAQADLEDIQTGIGKESESRKTFAGEIY